MRSAITAACSIVLAASFGFGTARAGDPTPAPAPQQSGVQAAANAKVNKAQSATCLTTTGSLMRPKPGHCVNAFGNVYTQRDLDRTGKITVSGALRLLDPALTVVH
jgi:hypothetical protein